MTTATKTLFLNHSSGQIACPDHAGHYLATAHKVSPDGASYDTPLGTWVRWTAIDENAWRQATGVAAGCESCGCGI